MQTARTRRLWLDLGGLGDLVRSAGPHEQWQDHGLGLLRTVLRNAGVDTEIASTRTVRSWRALARRLAGCDVLLMNVRSYTYPLAVRAARLFKELNPRGTVVAGGLHASVALDEMLEVPELDRICQGPGERTIVELARDPLAFDRVVTGTGARSMAEWPRVDRTLWPRPRRLLRRSTWPLEPACGWGPPPVATVLTSRACPWQCSFCNESAYVPLMPRRPVEDVIDELNWLDRRFGPIGSVVMHDSMFFQNPGWLAEWLEAYPRRARRRWPYWAAARSDTLRRWPELFAALVRETAWTTISIGLESGSDRVLRILNKECSVADNEFAIELVNRLGDELEGLGREPPRIWANLMLGVPGETREDALRTMRMLRRVRRPLSSISFYAPYPGSALGHQLIAEGRSRMGRADYHRYPSDEKVVGVDYAFYRELLAGRFDTELGESP